MYEGGMTHDLAIVGAGSAGLAATRTARELGLDVVTLEGSHRIGGRGYTEELAPGVAFDLGCHWMHSASLNPYVAIADSFGFTYRKGTFGRHLFVEGRWWRSGELADAQAFWNTREAAIDAAGGASSRQSLADVTDYANPWAGLADYWTSIATSADPDEVAVEDVTSYNDTDENWPLKQGFGALIARYGADLPVTLNCAVERIDWGGPEIVLHTTKGTVAARRVLVTVSTGILGAGDIRFDPILPAWKQAAIAGLPLGTHNRIGLLFDRNVFGDAPVDGGVKLRDGSFAGVNLRPFGDPWAVVYTGGRHAIWLEKAGQAAAIDHGKRVLGELLGRDAVKHVARAIVTAWHGDPWVKGSYSAALPGQAHQRVELARPIDDRLFFAGEACSTEFQATAHGAYITGVAAAQTVAKSLGRAVPEAAK
jgi:monoamine oxidase